MPSATNTALPDRRARRRQETIGEILAIAEQVMIEEGVNGLSLSEVARRLGVKPPSIYKYFDSLMSIYDAALRTGAARPPRRHARRHAGRRTRPRRPRRRPRGQLPLVPRPPGEGAAAVLAPRPQLRAHRPGHGPKRRDVSSPTPSTDRRRRRWRAGPGADSDEAVFVASIFVSGLIGQSIANEPGLPWGEGRFSPLFPKLLGTLVSLYPPKAERRRV